MSYYTSFMTKENKIRQIGHHDIKGGTYAIGGTTDAELNITYNYSKWFYKHIDKKQGIRFLQGKRVEEVIPILEKAISKMAGEPDEDYWAETEGNAKKALKDLLEIAKMCELDDTFDTD